MLTNVDEEKYMFSLHKLITCISTLVNRDLSRTHQMMRIELVPQHRETILSQHRYADIHLLEPDVLQSI